MTRPSPFLRAITVSFAALAAGTGGAALAQSTPAAAAAAIDPARTAQVGGTRLGQRQEDAAVVLGDAVNPYDRIGNRIQNRVQNRLNTRIDPRYRPRTGPVDPFKVADEATKAATGPRRR